MKRRILLLITGLLLAALVIILLAIRPSSDSYHYQGKTVRQWLQQVATTNHQAAVNAFHDMGTNAFPAIFRELRRNDPWWNRLYLRAYPSLPASLKRHGPLPIDQTWIWGSASFVLSDYLDRAGSRLVFSNLMQILGNKQCDARFSVFPPLAQQAGPWYKEHVPALTALAHDPDLDTSAMAAVLLWKIDGQTNAAVTALHDAMNSPRPCYMKDWAPYYLSEINPLDKSIVPALIANLRSTNLGLQVNSVYVLQKLGPAAAPAVPALTNLLNSRSPWPQFRYCVLDALQSIAPETAAKYQTNSAPAQ